MVRDCISDLLNEQNGTLQNNSDAREKCLIPMNNVQLLMPVRIGDYTDFYSSIDHATNMGKMFRDP